jgi:hypothetical protein
LERMLLGNFLTMLLNVRISNVALYVLRRLSI